MTRVSVNTASYPSGDYSLRYQVRATSGNVVLSDAPKLGLINRFQVAFRAWADQTAVFSSLSDIVSSPHFDEIVGMGRDALPMIFAEIERKPSFIFIAAKRITGVNPVLETSIGRVDLMCADWLRWANAEGIYASNLG